MRNPAHILSILRSQSIWQSWMKIISILTYLLKCKEVLRITTGHRMWAAEFGTQARFPDSYSCLVAIKSIIHKERVRGLCRLGGREHRELSWRGCSSPMHQCQRSGLSSNFKEKGMLRVHCWAWKQCENTVHLYSYWAMQAPQGSPNDFPFPGLWASQNPEISV